MLHKSDNLSALPEPEKEDKCYQIAEEVLKGLLQSISFAQNLTLSTLLLCAPQIPEQKDTIPDNKIPNFTTLVRHTNSGHGRQNVSNG